MSHTKAERARRRGNWVGTLTTLCLQNDAMIVRDGTAGDRIAMLWRVTLDAWASSGRPLPSYRRSEIPGRIVRR